MIKTLLTIAVAGLVLAGCKHDRSQGPTTVVYQVSKLTCDIGGEMQSFVFADNETIYHNVYILDSRINIEKRERETRNILEDHYWTGTCYLVKTVKTVVIEPEAKSFEEVK